MAHVIMHCLKNSVDVSWRQYNLLLYFVIIGDYAMEMRKLTFEDRVFFFWVLSSLNNYSPV
jgi:hypothetical protein